MIADVAWRCRAKALADRLVADGVLGPDWYEAFAATPRHAFVPRFYADDGRLVDGDDPAVRAEWLDAVYSDTSLVTQQAVAPATDLAWPTSSTTMPSLMARMLALLEVRPGQRVLEIGTGTGYNAALLGHRLGAGQVTSIDIDPGLVAAATTALGAPGYRPHLVAGNGADGVPERAPYHRIVATAAVPTIPAAWIDQLTADGRIVADVRGEIASSLVVARRVAPGTVHGRFHATAGHFMWLRTIADNPLRDGGAWPAPPDRGEAEVVRTEIRPDVFDDPDARFVAQLFLPDARSLWRTEYRGRPVTELTTEAGGWARITVRPGGDGTFAVAHGGPDSAWKRLAAAIGFWRGRGRPTADRFGFTAATDGTASYWLDTPDRPVPIAVRSR